jgi:hypothetical protein
MGLANEKTKAQRKGRQEILNEVLKFYSISFFQFIMRQLMPSPIRPELCFTLCAELLFEPLFGFCFAQQKRFPVEWI